MGISFDFRKKCDFGDQGWHNRYAILHFRSGPTITSSFHKPDFAAGSWYIKFHMPQTLGEHDI